MPKQNQIQYLLNLSTKLNIALLAIIALLVIAIVYQNLTIYRYVAQLSQNTTQLIRSQYGDIAQLLAKSSAVASAENGSKNQTNPTGTLSGINAPLNNSALSKINDEPLAYYESAGEKLLNGTLTNEVIVANSPQYAPVSINGKPSVIYIGATTCPYCGENRWAMALALARFGNFSSLYQGYSALQDGDVPTLYWVPANTTTAAGVDFGNHYSSNVINFISAEYESPISGHFEIQPLSYFVARAPNSTYKSAIEFMNSTGAFQGTPFTFWGTSLVAGADAVVLGSNNASTSSLGWEQISSMTHAQILDQIASFNNQFSWGEYAAADVYIAELCPAINNTKPVCALPAIRAIGAAMKLSS